MSFEFWGFAGPPYFSAPTGLFGWGLLALFAALCLGALIANLRALGSLSFGRWAALFALMAAGGLLAQLFIFRFPASILPPPGVPLEPEPLGFAPLALLPTFLAAGWLGIGPALLVGLATGLSRAAWETYSFLTPLEYGLAAALFAMCVRNNYWGWPARILRHPFVAGLAAAVLLSVTAFFSYYAYSPRAGLEAAEHIASLTAAAIPVLAAQALLAGLLATLARMGQPAWWRRPGPLVHPPYVGSLSGKLLWLYVPLLILALAAMFFASITAAQRVSTGLVIDQMSAAARTASRGIPFFIQAGQNLLANISAEEYLLSDDSDQRTTQLAQSLRAIPFFHQLTLLDTALLPVAGYPTAPGNLPEMDRDELQLARQALGGVPQNNTIFSRQPGRPVDIVFAVPVYSADGGIASVLMGHADLASSPLMQPAVNSLTGLVAGAGHGFLVDADGNIIYHPDPARLLQTFEFQAAGPRLHAPLPGASAYYDRASDGTRQLILFYPVAGHAWNVVVAVPNFVVLELAWQISRSAVMAVALLGLLGVLLIAWTTRVVTRPAVTLAHAAQRIADGHLDQPVSVGDPDEIGQAARAFEGMRVKLRARLDELGMLLGVSQSVAASFNLETALPPILEGVLRTTGAAGARLVLTPAADAPNYSPPPPHQIFSAGPAAELMAAMDRGVVQTTREDGAAVIENLARARAVFDVGSVAGRLHALLAFPLRLESKYYGALWLAYDKPHTFTETEISLVKTLAGQAAVSVANARLFEVAEQGRQRMSAILASTPDAVVAIDRHERLIMLNRAAEMVFGVNGHPLVGRPLAQVLPSPDLLRLFQADDAAAQPTSGSEIKLPSGRTLFARTTPMIGADGSVWGRMCVLSDVTRFKELDEMKSEFVATVSHDLRTPLTFMKGYATMLPVVGPLNAKQDEFAGKIISGVEQMTVLINDLLDLGRIEAGIGMVSEEVSMPQVVSEVLEALRPLAVSREQRVVVDVPSEMPNLSGDTALLRHAVNNLVSNAIKYTPTGGTVRLAAANDGEHLQLAVTDTGPGIAPTDQPHLFEKFYRVKQRGLTQVKGSGLGLAIVKNVVERHGGRVWVESRLGHGSTFYISLPLAAPPEPARRQP